MRMEFSDLYPASSDLRALADLTDEATKVVNGFVDATIHGRYFGDALSPEQKRVLQDLAIQTVIEKMMPVIHRLGENHDITFYDDANSPIVIIYDLQNMYKRRLDQAAAETPTT